MNNIPEELQMMAEALIHSATKHDFVFTGALFKDDDKAPVIMIIRNTNEKNPAELFRAFADMVDVKVTAGAVIEHKIGRLS